MRAAFGGLEGGQPGDARLTTCGGVMGFVAEFWKFLRVRKKLWLLPIVVVMLLLGGLLILAQGSAIAPFIYTLF
jgi:hypothetical protein